MVLKNLVNKKEISPLTFDSLKPISSVRPKLHELPKLHKPDVSLRPILSMIRSPQHTIAKYLNVLLEPVLQYFSRCILKDYFTFVEDIKKSFMLVLKYETY